MSTNNSININNAISDDQALEALLSSASAKQEEKERRNNKSHHHYKNNNHYNRSENNNHSRNENNSKQWNDHNDRKRMPYNGNGYGSNNGRNQYPASNDNKRQRKWNRKMEEKDDVKYQWGDNSSRSANASGNTNTGHKDNSNEGYYGPASTSNPMSKTSNNDEHESENNNVVKEKPNFGLSGALAQDDKTGNTYNGIVLKFSEPPEARTPNTRWRLYVFKKKTAAHGSSEDNDVIQTLHISKQSAYLFGRERKVADIPVDHPSLSKQHCVLQYRALPDKNDREQRLKCKPYLMDLGSTNGTFINGVRIDDARYYELRKGDVITLGASSREYVLLTENTTSSDL